MLSFRLSRILILAAFVFSLFLPQLSFAADSCTCFCGDYENGAVDKGKVDSTSKCSDICEDEGTIFVGCYTDPQYFPVEDDKCWTEDECTNWQKDVGSGKESGEWGGVSPTCSTSRGAKPMGHCYGPTRDAVLNVPILGVTAIGSIGEYVALAYRFLLPAMSLIAVVMLMVGGLEYVVSAGSSKRIEKAKERMKNAIIGLILLLLAYTLANLLDPRLVNFGQLRVPLIKQAIVLDPSTSCEVLEGYGYEISVVGNKAEACGSQGEITGVDNVDEEVANANFKVKGKCDYMGCDNGKACVAAGTKNVCVTCNDVTSINATGLGLVAPTESSCAAIASSADAADGNDYHKYGCFFLDVGLTDQCVEIKSEGDEFINCLAMRSEVDLLLARGGDACSLYEQIIFSASLAPDTRMASAGYVDEAKNICESDICNLREMADIKGCVFDEGTASGAVTSDNFFNTCTSVK